MKRFHFFPPIIGCLLLLISWPILAQEVFNNAATINTAKKIPPGTMPNPITVSDQVFKAKIKTQATSVNKQISQETNELVATLLAPPKKNLMQPQTQIEETTTTVEETRSNSFAPPPPPQQPSFSPPPINQPAPANQNNPPINNNNNNTNGPNANNGWQIQY